MKERAVIVIPGDDPPQCQGSPHLERLKPYGEVVLYTDRPQSPEEQIERVREADVIINSRGLVRWPGELLRALPRLKMITVAGVGTTSIDLEVARERDIVVCNVPGKTAPVVAEHAFGLMFAAAKRVGFYAKALREGRWVREDNILLQDKTLGVIGTGNIGAEMARLGKAIGMNVIAWTFHPSPERAERLGVRYVPLEELLTTADVVSLHLNLTEDTHHFIGRRELSLMKKGALLVNVARGAIVDTDALVEALNSGHLAGAAIDVYDVEPVPADHPLLQCDHVVLTPHCADMTPEGVEFLNEGMVDNVIAFLEGRPQNVVT